MVKFSRNIDIGAKNHLNISLIPLEVNVFDTEIEVEGTTPDKPLYSSIEFQQLNIVECKIDAEMYSYDAKCLCIFAPFAGDLE